MVETTKRRSRRDPSAAGPLAWVASLMRDNIVAVLLAMIVLVPLLTGTDLLNTTGKLIAFEVLGTLLLLLALSQADIRDLGSRLTKTLQSGPNLPLVLLGMFCFVSGAISPFPAFARMEMMRVGFGLLLYFVLVYHLRGKGHLQTLTDGLMLTTAAVSLCGLAEMAENGGTVLGSFGSHELLGSFLMLMLPLALTLGLTERGDTKRQLAAQSVALLAATCLLMARTRSAWLGAGVSLVMLSVLAWRYQTVAKNTQVGTSNMLQQMKQRKHLIIGPLLILFGALSLVVLLSQTGDILQKRAGTLAAVGIDDSFQAREQMWRGAAHMAAQRPLVGWGVGSYPVREARFTGLGDSAAQVLTHGTSHSNLAHNFYLQTAAETGLLGLGLYLTAVVLFFTTGVRALSTVDSGLRKAVLIGCLAAMAGQVVDAFGSPAYNFASVNMFQWVLMGLGMFAAGLGARNRPLSSVVYAQDRTAFGVSAPLLRRLQYGFAGLVALGVVSQIVPTMNAAFAQTCTIVPIGTFRTQTSGLSDIGPGQSTAVLSTFNGVPATGVTYSVTYSPPGAAALVTVTQSPAYALRIQRNATAAPSGGATITIHAEYLDTANRKYTNTDVIVILH